MSGKKLVIVESPTKAKTIRKFLSKDYIVESCMGHIRDLPKTAKDVPERYKDQKWARLGVNVEKDFDPLYCIPNDKKKVVSQLKSKMSDVSELYLATDEDREGESISWHLLEVLKPKIPVKRMVFHEITKSAILNSLENTRKIDENLVKAQEARRILDRLVGFSLSPLLWKKVAYGLSAGRVQSVALRLISEREMSRFKFKKALYYGVEARLEKSKHSFHSTLVQIKDKRVATGKDFEQETGLIPKDKQSQIIVLDQPQAKKALEAIKGKDLKVERVEEKPISRSPYAPFITSTLQQDASRKFGWSSRQTMRVAQDLYEKGFITYMRTDSVNLSEQAIKAARDSVKDLYGVKFLSKEVRSFKGKKVKGAQEAHEAIRPAGSQFYTPDDTGLSGDALKLYDLIWKRTLASQMSNSQQRQIQVKFINGDYLFSSSGTIIEFPGFLKVYEESTDESASKEEALPELKKGDSVKVLESKAIEHETKPPFRFTEAGLIQVMEKEGIGRPSTYAATISTIIDRGYVQRQGNTLIPTFTALIVAKLLSNYFPQYVDLKFTAEMEENLDEIADGSLDYLSYLKSIYWGKSGLKTQVEKQEKVIDPDEARSIQVQGLEHLSFRVGRYGAYVCRTKSGEEQCASLPETRPPSEITDEFANELIDQKINGADSLGKDPSTGLNVYVLNGRYGYYVQLGEMEVEKTTPKEKSKKKSAKGLSKEEKKVLKKEEKKIIKPKRVSIPPTIPVDTVDFKKALELLSLPKTLGTHPQIKKDVKLGIGRFGPYVVCDGDYRSVSKSEDFLGVDFERAMELLSQPKKGRGGRGSVLVKDLGPHPKSKEKDAIQVMKGRYGAYLKWGKKNFSIPKDQDMEKMTMEIALGILSQKEDSSTKNIGADGGSKATLMATKPSSFKGLKKLGKKELLVKRIVKKKAHPKKKKS